MPRKPPADPARNPPGNDGPREREASPRSSRGCHAVATAHETARLEAFLASLRERGRRQATLDAYQKDWRSLARWYGATTGQPFDLAQLTPMDAADFAAFLVRTARPATVARRLLFLRAYLREVQTASGEVTETIVRKVAQLRPPKSQTPAPRGLRAAEARAALRAVEQRGSARDRAVVFTLLMTGIRVGELCGLDRADVTLGDRSGSLRVRAAVAKGGREREVPLPKEVREYLAEYLTSRTDDSPALLVGQRGRMTPSGAGDIVARFAGVSPHRLRHTFAYEYLRVNNNDLVALADILGHASLNTTRTYTRRRKEDLQEGVARVRYGKDT